MAMLAMAALCAGAPARGADKSIQREMLEAHNEVREKLGLPPLHWSAKLAGVAYNWAMTLLLNDAFLHRPRNFYGENMYEIRGGKIGAREVVANWAAEASDYNLRLNTCRGKCGHYTQIVWRDTREVGCAVARSSFREVWVCNYDPPGNIIGRRPY